MENKRIPILKRTNIMKTIYSYFIKVSLQTFGVDLYNTDIDLYGMQQ